MKALALASLVTCVALPCAAQVPLYSEPDAGPRAPAASEASGATTEQAPAPESDAEAPPSLMTPEVRATRAMSTGVAAPFSALLRPARVQLIAKPRPVPPAPVHEPTDFELSERYYWYGWQTLIADGSSATVIVAGALLSGSDQANGNRLAAAGLAGYWLAPGVLHFAHGNAGPGFISIGMRLGLPLAGVILGASLSSGCEQFLCEERGASIGLLVGMGASVALDATLLANDRPSSLGQRATRLRPVVALTPSRAVLGVAGSL